jgi:type I restriction enzyme S subunit
MEFEPHELERYLLRDGDIVLSEASGSPDQVGKPAIWREQIPDCCFQNTVIRLRGLNLSSEYLLIVFKSFYFNSLFARVAAGVGINHLSANKFCAIAAPLAPLLEQDYIITTFDYHISIADKLEAIIEVNLKRAERLRQSILKKAFEGKLVPQDPTDEPADKLLERIKAEKAKREAETKTKKTRKQPGKPK